MENHDPICGVSVEKMLISELQTWHQHTETATSASVCTEAGSKELTCKDQKEVTFVWDFSVGVPVLSHCIYKLTLSPTSHDLWVQFRGSYRNTVEKAHLTSNVSFKDRCIDINIKIHSFPQHTNDSLELGNISQDLQGTTENKA